ncbi:carbonic anhydrase [Candidatus Neomarinimicrobiota bacterium]
MKISFSFGAILLMYGMGVSTAMASDDMKDGAEWSYEGNSGPEYWGDLDPAYIACIEGHAQSPVDIVETVKSAKDDLKVNYAVGNGIVRDNGHTWEVVCEPGNYLKVSGQRYDLRQFHFHSPGEHWVGGRPFDMELHFVHTNTNGDVVILGILLDIGDENQFINKIWQNVPGGEGDDYVEEIYDMQLTSLIEPMAAYYTYKGSLTMPPCSEGVNWIILAKPQTVSYEQVRFFGNIFPNNNRPLQPLNSRKVREDIYSR